MKRKIQIEIEGDGVYCGDCNDKTPVYGLAFCKKWDNYLGIDDTDRLVRCPACMAAMSDLIRKDILAYIDALEKE